MDELELNSNGNCWRLSVIHWDWCSTLCVCVCVLQWWGPSLRSACLRWKMLAPLCRSVIRIGAGLERSRKHMLMLRALVMASQCQHKWSNRKHFSASNRNLFSQVYFMALLLQITLFEASCSHSVTVVDPAEKTSYKCINCWKVTLQLGDSSGLSFRYRSASGKRRMYVLEWMI